MDISSLSSATPATIAAARPAPNATAAPPGSVAASAAPASSAAASNLTVQATPAANETQATRQELDQAVKEVSDFVGVVNADLSFSVDEDTGRTVVKVVDNATKEVIKQIPSKEMLELAKALDGIKGLLVKQNV